jgi:hypothetical protein
MKAVDFKQSNLTLVGDDCFDLPVYHDNLQSISCWKPSEEELAEINLTGTIWLSVIGQHPPVMLSGKSPFEEDKDAHV